MYKISRQKDDFTVQNQKKITINHQIDYFSPQKIKIVLKTKNFTSNNKITPQNKWVHLENIFIENFEKL